MSVVLECFTVLCLLFKLVFFCFVFLWALLPEINLDGWIDGWIVELKPVSDRFQQFHAFYHMKPKPVFKTISLLNQTFTHATCHIYLFTFLCRQLKIENLQYVDQVFVFNLVKF